MAGPSTIADLWDTYRIKVLPDAGPIQILECRRAFYAGIAGWNGLIVSCLEETDDLTVSDQEWLDARHDELMRFAAQDNLLNTPSAGRA